MALEQSILKGTKKKLGLDAEYDAFDHDVIDYINGAFFRLYQLGVGPPEGFEIEDDTEEWDDFFPEDLPRPILSAVKSFITLKVRLLFDPPGTSYHINAIEEQLTELEHTILTERDLIKWTASSSSPSLP